MSTPVPVTMPSSGEPQPDLADERPGHWPRDIIEAYARYPGPYTVENAETILEEEPVELYNGWLLWQEMTDLPERRLVATLQTMLDLSARKSGFGQTLPDQLECLLSDESVVKPDASLVSWQRLQNDVRPSGPRQRLLLLGGPELVVEVRSPSNRRAQERRKRQLYFVNHVEIVWDVDPVRQTIWVYQTTAPAEPRQYTMTDVIDCALLPGWQRQVADIFAEQASAEVVAGEVAQAWRAEGKAAGLAAGRAAGLVEGRAAGLAEGRAETLRDMLPMFVQMRFGAALPADGATRLARCQAAQLQRLQSAVATCASLEEWLQVLTAITPE